MVLLELVKSSSLQLVSNHMISTIEQCVFKPSRISRIKELTNILSEETKELDIFFNLCPDLLCIASVDGYFIKMNPAWERELGWTIHELTERPFFDFLHPEDVEKTKKVISEMSFSRVNRFINRYKIKGSDSYMPLEWNATSWMDDYTYAVAREISEECVTCKYNQLSTR